MKLAKAALASAILAAFAAPAFAQATLENVTDTSSTLTITGGAAVTGTIPVAAQAGATASNTQASVDNLVITAGGANDASLTDSANDIAGNAGVNIAAGSGNAQGNEAAIAALGDAADVFGSAQTFSTQISGVNTNISLLTDNAATMSGSANNATGNVGVNIASGSGNMQDNQLAAAAQTNPAGDGALAQATGSNEQLVTLAINGDLDFDVTNSATVTGSLLGAAGNLGANVSAGYGNLQHNSLSIASTQ